MHETRYAYAAPVSLAHHLAHLKPLTDSHQQLLAFNLDIEPAPSHCRDGVDGRGNAERHFSLATPHRRLRVRSTSRVRVRPRTGALDSTAAGGALDAAAGPPWDAVAGRLPYVARAPFVPEIEFALPSPYVPRMVALRHWATPSLRAGRPVAEVAVDLMQRIHGEFIYKSRSTDIDTPLAEVLQHKRGVCQDFAHLMCGALRMFGLPARYVSGYLLTDTGPGGRAVLGADASHAWVQAWCPGTPGVAADGWLDLDPTNNVLPGSGHVRLAVGRDYGDVAPLRGVIRGGGGKHTLTVAVRTQHIKTEHEE